MYYSEPFRRKGAVINKFSASIKNQPPKAKSANAHIAFNQPHKKMVLKD